MEKISSYLVIEWRIISFVPVGTGTFFIRVSGLSRDWLKMCLLPFQSSFQSSSNYQIIFTFW